MQAEQEAAEVTREDGLLQKMAAAYEIEHFALAQAVDKIGIAAVRRQAAQQRAGAVNVAGAYDGPGHVTAVGVLQFEFAEAFVTAVAGGGIVFAFLGLRKATIGRVEDEVGGDEGQVARTLAEGRDVLHDVFGLVANAVDDEIPVGFGFLYGTDEGAGISAVGDEGMGAVGNGAMAASEYPGFKVLCECGAGESAADETTAADDKDFSGPLCVCIHSNLRIGIWRRVVRAWVCSNV